MKILYTFLGLVFAMSISAQDAFHRIYPFNSTDSLQLVTDGIQLADDGFATLGRDVAIDGTNNPPSYAVTISRYDTKGDLLTSRDVYLADSALIASSSKIVQMQDGNFVFTAGLVGTDQASAVVAVDKSTGEAIWSKRMGEEFNLNAHIDNYPGDQLVVSSTNILQGNSLWMSMLTSSGEELWSKEYTSTDMITGVEVQQDLFDTYVSQIDSSMFLSGAMFTNGAPGYHLSKVDKEGTPVWSNNFMSDPAGLRIQPNNIIEMPDSSVYVSGLVFLNAADIALNHWIAKHDKDGNLLWSKGLTQPTDFSIGVGLSIKGENLVVAVQANDDLFTPGAPVFPLIIEIDTAGAVVNAQTYPETMTNFAFAGALHTTSDDGLVLFSTYAGQDGVSADIIKTRPDLTTNCSEASGARLEDLELIQTAAMWTAVDFMNSDTIETDINSIIDLYDLPIISPRPEQWCPNDQIIDTLDATPSPLPEGEISYLWAGPGVDGQTTADVIAMEEGEFMVTVTINDDHCYTLCDTVNVTKMQLPMVTIAQDPSQFCETQEINLISQPIFNASGLESLTWSTSEDNPVISVDAEGSYSVTIIDGCGDQVSATTEVIFPEQLESLNITEQLGDDCNDFQGILSAETNLAGSPDIMYEWNTGDETAVLAITEPGVYFVTVTNCDIELRDSIPVTLLSESTALQYPEVFFPLGEEELNRTFGPNNPCGLDLSSYELKIFNRWGQEVFSSSNIEDEWNGNYNGSPGQSAVYVWYAEYTIEGQSEPEPLLEGDVTLLRSN